MADQPDQPQLPNIHPELFATTDDAERAACRDRLREHLRAPDFRAIEGFPIGDDEAILALSDPPYYTACPNPFLPEIIERWQAERAQLREELGLPDDSQDNGDGGPIVYHREPFASDVSEGKNDPIYNAHSYHTKVPHKAVMRYILHYTDPGDIVFDGFCGTGMTGVAAQLCGDRKAVAGLGYRVKDDGMILDEQGQAISRLGMRKAVLVDLSPAATFIAYNYNTPVDVAAFEREAQRILREVEDECGWMYETWHPYCDHPQRVKGRINYTVWSDVFVCPQCGEEIVFWDVAVDKKTGKVLRDWPCPGCGVLLAKSPRKQSGALKVERAWDTFYDRVLGQAMRLVREVPVLINYSVGKKRYEKTPDDDDWALIRRIEEEEVHYWFPTNGVSKGDKTSDPFNFGITHVHHFYTRRNLLLMSLLWKHIGEVEDIQERISLRFLWQSLALGYTRLNRYGATHYSQVNRILNGTLYVSSLISEVSLRYAFDGKIRRMTRAFSLQKLERSFAALSTQSSARIRIPKAILDYIFVDPPFGSNLMYSELRTCSKTTSYFYNPITVMPNVA